MQDQLPSISNDSCPLLFTNKSDLKTLGYTADEAVVGVFRMAYSQEQISQIELVSQCFIRPKYEVEASKQPHYLGPADLALLSADPIQRGLLFQTKPENMKSLLQKLHNSLSLSLAHFYPLAGQLATQKSYDEHAILVYVDCNKGPGARLIYAASYITVSDLISSVDVPLIVRSLFDLGERAVNHDGHTRPLLSIQVTELVDGVFIGFTINHSVADGTSLSHFIFTLSEIFLQLDDGGMEDVISISRKPIFKPFFPDTYGPIMKLPFLEPDEFITRYDRGALRERIFHFSSASVSKLKAKVNAECGVHNISSFQALFALTWRSITRARNMQPDRETACTIAADSRPRVNPPLSSDCFGNIVLLVPGSCKAGELLGNGLGWAAMFVHQRVIAHNENAILERLKYYVERGTVYQLGKATANTVAIGGSTKVDIYGTEFGLGKAVAVLNGNGNKRDGKVIANQGHEGGASMDLTVCLKHETMNALELDEEFTSFVTSV